jgi:ABC-type amino acid transport substrate-binding protein
MSFALFAGWFAGTPVSATQYPAFVGTGLVSFFGSIHVAIPLLLDLLHIPVDLYQLYLAIGLITDRFATLLTTMNNLMLTLLGACAVSGLLIMRWGKVLRNAVLSVVLIAATIGGMHVFFNQALNHNYQKDKIIGSMQLLRHAGPATVYRSPPPPRPPADPQQSRLKRIQAQGIVRVGYLPDSLPFTYINAAGQLVGFNVEMAHTLAQDLGVWLDLVPVTRGPLMAEQLRSGYCDIVMSPVAVTPERAQNMAFSISYMDQTLAFIVKDHRRGEFSSREAIWRLKKPRIATLNVQYYIDKVHRYVPQATIVVINSVKEFFEARDEQFDALLFSAEAGSAWSLLYPAYTVAIPQPDVLAVPLAYPLPRGDPEWVNFINSWIDLKRKDKTIASLYDHWILGKNAVPKQPRWSVLRNVLGIGTEIGASFDEKREPWL